MPNVQKGESQKDFVSRCIPYLMKQEQKTQAQATAICYNLYKQAKIKPKRRSRKKRQTPTKRK